MIILDIPTDFKCHKVDQSSIIADIDFLDRYLPPPKSLAQTNLLTILALYPTNLKANVINNIKDGSEIVQGWVSSLPIG